MRLYVARHGDALAASVDPQRALSKRGESEVKQVAAYLAEDDVQVARVIASPKQRALETAKLLARTVAKGVEVETDRRLEPDGDPTDLVAELEALTEDTLLVGHLPHVGRLLSVLLTGRDGDGPVVFRTGTIACLERDEDEKVWRFLDVLEA